MDQQAQAKDQAESAVADERARRSRSESQWAVIWRQFRKRKLAVASTVVILILVTTSIFAPFLANDRPIFYRGYNQSEHRTALRTARAKLGEISRETLTAEERAESLEDLHFQFDLMRQNLAESLLDELNQFAADVDRAYEAEDFQALARMRSTLRRQFDARKVSYREQAHWPILASLTWLDTVFLVFNVVLLSMPVWDKLLRIAVGRQHSTIRGMVRLSTFFVLPLVAGGLWKLTVPERVDLTNYKSGVLAEADEELLADASVVYRDVVWPLIPYGLDEDNLDQQNLPPIWLQSSEERDTVAQTGSPWNPAHVLGTDSIGRDNLSRMLWGGRVSLSVGIVAVSIYVSIGIIVGAIAGYFRGFADLLISRVIEIVICFPSFFLILTIVAFIGPSIFNIMMVIGLTGWTSVARLVRGEFLRLSEQEFVLAGRALGYKPQRIIFRHVLPNALAPVLVSATFGIAGAILTESGLSFLGLGITVPKPSWGGILATGREALMGGRDPWLIYLPGLAIFVTITAYNLVGEALRDAADPRLRGRGH